MKVYAIIWLLTAFKAINADIPEIFKVCDRDGPDLNKCLKNAIKLALVSLPGGYNHSKLLNISPLDPYFEKEMIIEYKRNQIVAKAITREIMVYGLSKSKVHDVRAELQDESMVLEVDLSNKQVFIEGLFKSEGRLNAIVLNTKLNYFNNTMSDLTWTWKIYGKSKERNGKKYMKVYKFVMRPDVGHMVPSLPVLFVDNPELDKIARDFALNNWKLIYNELLPIVEQVWDKVGRRICNKVFMNIPYDELFPTSL